MCVGIKLPESFLSQQYESSLDQIKTAVCTFKGTVCTFLKSSTSMSSPESDDIGLISVADLTLPCRKTEKSWRHFSQIYIEEAAWTELCAPACRGTTAIHQNLTGNNHRDLKVLTHPSPCLRLPPVEEVIHLIQHDEKSCSLSLASISISTIHPDTQR